MKKFLIILLIFLIILAVITGGYYYYSQSKKPKIILSFEDCLASDQLVVDTNPRECHTKDGKVYIEEDNHVSLTDYVVVSNPLPYSIVTTPFKVEGKAKAGWFSANRITITLLDSNQKVLVSKPVYALTAPTGDTMVPFVAAIDFQTPGTVKGKLLIEKASSTDFPTKNGPLIIPVSFK